ncbi:MAG: hypothetical protein EB084_25530 [Proteobacteria bacterium]|nr:hypothetical protein [Pseudomonadota bacterium]
MMIAVLERLVCARCEEMLEDAVTCVNGKRVCLACTCDGCREMPYRYRDEDNDDRQLCEKCVISELTTRHAEVRS